MIESLIRFLNPDRVRMEVITELLVGGDQILKYVVLEQRKIVLVGELVEGL